MPIHSQLRVLRRAQAVAALDSRMSSSRHAREGPISVRLVTLVGITAHISRAHNVFDERRLPGPAWESTDGPPGARLPEGP